MVDWGESVVEDSTDYNQRLPHHWLIPKGIGITIEMIVKWSGLQGGKINHCGTAM